MTFVQQVYDFNSQAGLLEKPYNDFLESSFQIEEAIEGFNLPALIDDLGLRIDFDSSAKAVSRTILSSQEHTVVPDVDRLDKAIDAIVFALGSIYKLGLTPEQASRAISVVCEANLQKLSMPKDEHGKLLKPPGFVGPESKLQAILDERP